jgi:hypothetical protein
MAGGTIDLHEVALAWVLESAPRTGAALPRLGPWYVPEKVAGTVSSTANTNTAQARRRPNADGQLLGRRPETEGVSAGGFPQPRIEGLKRA